MSIGTKKTHTCSFTGRKRAGSSEGQNVKALQTNLIKFAFGRWVFFCRSFHTAISGSRLFKISWIHPTWDIFFQFLAGLRDHHPATGGRVFWLAQASDFDIYIYISMFPPGGSEIRRSPVEVGKSLSHLFTRIYTPHGFFPSGPTSKLTTTMEICRLYDWFSEYRLRAAGREDILEKALAVPKSSSLDGKIQRTVKSNGNHRPCSTGKAHREAF